MRVLYLVRHAKSSWKDTEMPDFERPLNRRGERDAPGMGSRMANHHVRPDGIITSGAVRALATAKVIAAAIGFPADRMVIDNVVYEADAGDLLARIQAVDNRWKTVMVVGHNPAITDLVNALTDEFIENVPTCGVAEITFDGDDWAKIAVGTGHLARFDYPKNSD